MIDKLDLDASLALAQQYSKLPLDTVADTPLSLLCRDISVDEIPDGASYDDVVTSIVDLSRTEVRVELREHVAELAASAVRSTMDVTRNKVIPHINRVLDSFESRMQDIPDDILPFDIVQKSIPAYYKTRTAADFLSNWQTAARIEPPAGDRLIAEMTADEVMQAIVLTDVEDFNTKIKQYLDTDPKALAELVEFINGRRVYSKLCPHAELAAVILLESIKEPTEGVAGTLDSWRTYKVLVTNHLAQSALTHLDWVDNSLKGTVLYVSGRTEGVIEVQADVYRKLLGLGLTSEALIGNELLGRKYYGMDLVDPDNLKDCESAYQRNYELRKKAHEANRTVLSNEAIRNALRDDVKHVAEKDDFVIEGDTQEKAWNRLRTLTDKIYSTPYLQLEPTLVISALVVGTWYAHTDAARYLDLMYNAEREAPGMSGEELATVVFFQYLSEWICSQLTVRKEIEAI